MDANEYVLISVLAVVLKSLRCGEVVISADLLAFPLLCGFSLRANSVVLIGYLVVLLNQPDFFSVYFSGSIFSKQMVRFVSIYNSGRIPMSEFHRVELMVKLNPVQLS